MTGYPIPEVTFGYQEAGKPWQVIFRTRDGKDYCRETRPASESGESIKTWAQAQAFKHELAGARIERW